MSPHVADPFVGHLPKGDPRGPLSAAGGCNWPTIPAYRYWLISDDATIDLAFLNTRPILLEFTSLQPAHNLGVWQLLGTSADVDSAIAVKLFTPGTSIYMWVFGIEVTAIPEAPLQFNVPRSVETCNRDIPLPNTWAFDIDRGVTGDTFRMEQIEWDKESPPPDP